MSKKFQNTRYTFKKYLNATKKAFTVHTQYKVLFIQIVY